MDKEYIVRRVKAKMNFIKKIKELKDKVLKKDYKTLNEENAVAYAEDLGKEHYWGFDVPAKPKITKRTYQGVPVIDIAIENSRDKFGDSITVWFDPILGKLFGDYKVVSTQHAKHRPAFQFKPLTEENALAYVKSVSDIKIDDKKKPKKTKQDGYPMVEIPILADGHEHSFMVWYDPGYMGLYGEW